MTCIVVRARSSMDRVMASGASGWAFESPRAREKFYCLNFSRVREKFTRRAVMHPFLRVQTGLTLFHLFNLMGENVFCPRIQFLLGQKRILHDCRAIFRCYP